MIVLRWCAWGCRTVPMWLMNPLYFFKCNTVHRHNCHLISTYHTSWLVVKFGVWKCFTGNTFQWIITVIKNCLNWINMLNAFMNLTVTIMFFVWFFKMTLAFDHYPAILKNFCHYQASTYLVVVISGHISMVTPFCRILIYVGKPLRSQQMAVTTKPCIT